MNDLVPFQPFKVGDTVDVGEFFWIPEDAVIGWDRDARHGNGAAKSSGSVDEGCKLTIRHIQDGTAIVRLDRPHMPFGALASIGIVFEIAVSTMLRWPAMMEARAAREKEREAKAKLFCK